VTGIKNVKNVFYIYAGDHRKGQKTPEINNLCLSLSEIMLQILQYFPVMHASQQTIY